MRPFETDKLSIKTVGLADARIRGIIPPATSRIELPDQIIPGLRIRAGQSGIKAFVLRKRVGDTWKNITFGAFKAYFSLADARKKARSILLDIEDGKGAPRIAKEDGTAATRRLMITLLWNQYLDRAGRKHKRSASEIERIGNKFLLPCFNDRMANSIGRTEIFRLDLLQISLVRQPRGFVLGLREINLQMPQLVG